MKIRFPFFENSRGDADGAWTLTVIAFLFAIIIIVTRLAAALGLLKQFSDPGLMGDALSLLALCGGTYFGRKFTDRWPARGAAPKAAAAPNPNPRGSRREIVVNARVEGAAEVHREVADLGAALDELQGKAETTAGHLKAVRAAVEREAAARETPDLSPEERDGGMAG